MDSVGQADGGAGARRDRQNRDAEVLGAGPGGTSDVLTERGPGVTSASTVAWVGGRPAARSG